jgi:hypothetical protein
MARRPKPRLDLKDPKNAMVVRLTDELRREVRKRHGDELTYEQRRNAAAEVMADVLWSDESRDLEELVTDDDEVDIAGTRYRRMDQASSAVYFSRWGSHFVEEALYREVGVHNGATIKPIEIRVGMIARTMTPDLARIAGEMGAYCNSRQMERLMRSIGFSPPSRSFLENRVGQMAEELTVATETLDEAARAADSHRDEVASVSCGMDRFSVRMSEPHSNPDEAPEPRRDKPYERTPPPPKEHKYRMAWVGTATAYDSQGEPIQTWRYAANADEEVGVVAQRVASQVEHLVQKNPGMPVHCVQDGAPELSNLPTRLRKALEPLKTDVCELTDFEHLGGYLDDVVDACEAAGDPNDMKGWYRMRLLQDDDAIDAIYKSLQRKAKKYETDTKGADAIAAALSYIRTRKDKMRYASHKAANLTIGSGVTEGTCGLMQERVKRRGQSWEPTGLRGVLTIRGFVLSDCWDAVWESYASERRGEVSRVAA